MAWRFVRQPDGLLARFSDVVDDFTHASLTDAEAVRVCVAEHGMREDDARQKVAGAMADLDPRTKQPGDGLARWRDSLAAIDAVHGRRHRDGIVREILANATRKER